MLYFFRKTIVSSTLEDGQGITKKLQGDFEVNTKGKFYLLQRKRLLDGLKIFRLFFPRVITKLTIDKGMVKYRCRLDALGLFMLVMVFGGIIVEFTMDRMEYPRDYPVWTPFALFAWYVGVTIYETSTINKTIQALLRSK